jgi:hypothetical protein
MARMKGAQKKGESPNTLTKATMEVDPESPAPGPDFAPLPDLIPFDPVEEAVCQASLGETTLAETASAETPPTGPSETAPESDSPDKGDLIGPTNLFGEPVTSRIHLAKPGGGSSLLPCSASLGRAPSSTSVLGRGRDTVGCFGGPVGGALGGSLDGIKLPAFPASSAGLASIGGKGGAGKGGRKDLSKAGRLGGTLTGSLSGSLDTATPVVSFNVLNSKDSCSSALLKTKNNSCNFNFLGQIPSARLHS